MKLIEADAKCQAVQKMVFDTLMGGRPVNAVKPEKENWRAVTQAGNLIINDVIYGTHYPNSFLDIWYPDEDQTKKRPVVINFHGGGFIFGSKKTGDPLALSASDGNAYIEGVLKQGFIFVNADYALAPDYRFPVQIIQADQVVRFVLENAEQYGFDTDNITMTGGSAGADITEIYAMAVSDLEYANMLGFRPALKPGGLRCVMINESALQFDGMVNNENMVAMLQTWLGDDDFAGSRYAGLANVAKHIHGVYPPAFLIASNAEDFFKDEAFAMHRVLTKQGLPNELFYVEPSVSVLNHGFINELPNNQHAKDCYEKMLAFLAANTR